MLAAMNGHTPAVKLLLDMGSDINAQVNHEGCSAVKWTEFCMQKTPGLQIPNRLGLKSYSMIQHELDLQVDSHYSL